MRHLSLVFLMSAACVGQPEEMSSDDPSNTDGLQVLYRFEEGEGLDVHDTSGVQPPFDLQLDNLVTNRWIEGGGVEITGPSVITSIEVAEKVFVACVQANAVSIEMWIEPAMDSQTGPATVFTYGKQNNRNLTIQQDTTRYRGSVMTSNPDPMAMTGQLQSLQTPEKMAAVAAQHVVFTRDVTGMNIYVNGVDAIPPPMNPPPPPAMPPPQLDQGKWSPAYQLAFGNETNGGRPWLGKIYMAAVYAKKLTAPEVAAKFAAGH
jgi:Concanavalin A-like lectin/glucanases superfamily